MVGTKRYQSPSAFRLRLDFTRDARYCARQMLLELEVILPNPPVLSQIISEPYVDAERAAEHLSISRKTLLRFARRGVVPGHGIGEGRKRMWRFRISELDHWMQTEVTSVSDEGRSAERKNFL
jgi:hypothetical protein